MHFAIDTTDSFQHLQLFISMQSLVYGMIQEDSSFYRYNFILIIFQRALTKQFQLGLIKEGYFPLSQSLRWFVHILLLITSKAVKVKKRKE